MEQYLIHDLYRTTPADGTQISVSGWVRTVRDSKAFAFIELNDGSFFKNLQVVCDESLPEFKEVAPGHFAACHRINELGGEARPKTLQICGAKPFCSLKI